MIASKACREDDLDGMTDDSLDQLNGGQSHDYSNIQKLCQVCQKEIA